jgi:hypothetical protein
MEVIEYEIAPCYTRRRVLALLLGRCLAIARNVAASTYTVVGGGGAGGFRGDEATQERDSVVGRYRPDLVYTPAAGQCSIMGMRFFVCGPGRIIYTDTRNNTLGVGLSSTMGTSSLVCVFGRIVYTDTKDYTVYEGRPRLNALL